MFRTLLLIAVGFSPNAVVAASMYVNCNNGQSLNSALSHLDPKAPNTLWVQGTCTEYIRVAGFDGLTLKGLSGATLVQPTTNPIPAIATAVLLIDGSRSVTVDGFTLSSPSAGNPAIGIGHGSGDIRLRNLTITGGGHGIVIFERSQVSIAQVTVRDPGFATLGVYDQSDVHIEGGSLFESTNGAPWHIGINVASSHLTLRGATIRNMQIGINVSGGGSVNVQNTANYYPVSEPSEVLIESPAGTNFDGVSINDTSGLSVADAVLRITNAGQSWGGSTGGILESGGSTLDGNTNLLISSSLGQGIVVADGSHASLNGASITAGLHGGVVVVNLSTLSVGSATGVSGNAVDLFCDSKSLISGSTNVMGASAVQCGNLLPTAVPLP